MNRRLRREVLVGPRCFQCRVAAETRGVWLARPNLTTAVLFRAMKQWLRAEDWVGLSCSEGQVAAEVRCV